jgi:hypothetical protein
MIQPWECYGSLVMSYRLRMVYFRVVRMGQDVDFLIWKMGSYMHLEKWCEDNMLCIAWKKRCNDAHITPFERGKIFFIWLRTRDKCGIRSIFWYLCLIGDILWKWCDKTDIMMREVYLRMCRVHVESYRQDSPYSYISEDRMHPKNTRTLTPAKIQYLEKSPKCESRKRKKYASFPWSSLIRKGEPGEWIPEMTRSIHDFWEIYLCPTDMISIVMDERDMRIEREKLRKFFDPYRHLVWWYIDFFWRSFQAYCSNHASKWIYRTLVIESKIWWYKWNESSLTKTNNMHSRSKCLECCQSKCLKKPRWHKEYIRLAINRS